MKYISDSTEKTINYAKEFASKLHGGEVIFLIGELGSGKTHFTKGIAEAFGVHRADIVSPTFIILDELHGPKLNLVHVDLYRIDDYSKLGFDLEEFINKTSVLLIEWADKFIENLPSPDFVINFEYGETSDSRVISIEENK